MVENCSSICSHVLANPVILSTIVWSCINHLSKVSHCDSVSVVCKQFRNFSTLQTCPTLSLNISTNNCFNLARLEVTWKFPWAKIARGYFCCLNPQHRACIRLSLLAQRLMIDKSVEDLAKQAINIYAHHWTANCVYSCYLYNQLMISLSIFMTKHNRQKQVFRLFKNQAIAPSFKHMLRQWHRHVQSRSNGPSILLTRSLLKHSNHLHDRPTWPSACQVLTKFGCCRASICNCKIWDIKLANLRVPESQSQWWLERTIPIINTVANTHFNCSSSQVVK